MTGEVRLGDGEAVRAISIAGLARFAAADLLLDLLPEFVWVGDVVERLECSARSTDDDTAVAEHSTES